jgi:prepilin-type processing-associated H-X9-DG protein
MYLLDDGGTYPLAMYQAHWPGPASEWVDLLRPYYPVDWTNRAYHCPAYKGYISSQSGDFFGSYGYNAVGTWQWGNWPSRNLGLGGFSIEQIDRPSTVPEAQVLAPSSMIEFGEPLINRDSSDGVPLGASPDNMFPLPISGHDRALFKYPVRHGRNCNVVFCDAHVEAMLPWKLYEMTNAAILWNNDHQPHPETWNWY